MFVEQRQRRRSTLSLEVQKMAEGKTLTHFQVSIHNDHDTNHHHDHDNDFLYWRWPCWGKLWLLHSSSHQVGRTRRQRWRALRIGKSTCLQKIEIRIYLKWRSGAYVWKWVGITFLTQSFWAFLCKAEGPQTVPGPTHNRVNRYMDFFLNWSELS